MKPLYQQTNQIISNLQLQASLIPVCQPLSIAGHLGSELRTIESEIIPWKTGGRQVEKQLSLDFDNIDEHSLNKLWTNTSQSGAGPSESWAWGVFIGWPSFAVPAC